MNKKQLDRSMNTLYKAGVIIRTIYSETLEADPYMDLVEYIRPTCPEVVGIAFEFNGASIVLGNGETRFHAFENVANDILHNMPTLTDRYIKRLVSAMLTVGLALVTYYD